MQTHIRIASISTLGFLFIYMALDIYLNTDINPLLLEYQEKAWSRMDGVLYGRAVLVATVIIWLLQMLSLVGLIFDCKWAKKLFLVVVLLQVVCEFLSWGTIIQHGLVSAVEHLYILSCGYLFARVLISAQNNESQNSD